MEIRGVELKNHAGRWEKLKKKIEQELKKDEAEMWVVQLNSDPRAMSQPRLLCTTIYVY